MNEPQLTFLDRVVIGLTVIAFVLLLLAVPKAKAQTPAYHTVQLGWSLGPMDGIETYGSWLFPSETKNDRGHYRVFIGSGPNIDTAIAPIINKVKYIIDKSQAVNKWVTIILVLRDFPYNDLYNHNLGNLTPAQRNVAVYSNRFTPTNIAAYERYLRALMEELRIKMYLPHIKIELWGEPNAQKWFWGYDGEDITFPAFYNLTAIKYNIVKDYPVDIYHAALSSSAQRDREYKENENYWDYVDDDSFFLGPITRSHSFYWYDSGGEFNVDSNDWIDRPGNVAITEYNLFVKVVKGKATDSIFNSAEWGWRFYEFLKFIYAKHQEGKGSVKEIYIHSLCNYSNKEDDKGSMGLMKKMKNPDFSTYYTPTKAWIAMKDIHSVIKDGYYPIAGGLQGKKNKIIFNNNKSYTITP